MSYWYVEGRDGRHYCWSKQATDVCPNRDGAVIQTAIAGMDTGMDPELIGKGCSAGAPYDTWVEELDPEEYRHRIADRLGFGTPFRRVDGSFRRFKLKREAAEYAREQAAVADLVGAE